MLAARENETEIHHDYNRNITKGLHDHEIVAHMIGFILAV